MTDETDAKREIPQEGRTPRKRSRLKSRIGMAPRLPALPELRRAGPSVPGAPARPTSIIPPRNVAGRALTLVIGIMTFLCCLTIGGVSLVSDAATRWQGEISREATIQIRPAENFDMAAALDDAQRIASSFDGVTSVRIVDDAATARLLEPWLGSGLDLSELPVPRLVLVTIDEANPPDFPAMRTALTAQVDNLSLDDHRTLVYRLVAMAGTTIGIGIVVLAMMVLATMLTVVFAARGAMAGNDTIIEVLHFVGAEASFIARQFRRHFLLMGLRGAASGGGLALLLLLGFHLWSRGAMATPEADQVTALFGDFQIGLVGWAGVCVLVAVIAILTAVTSHVTVLRYLGEIDRRAADAT